MRDLGILVVNDDHEILETIERLFGYFKVKINCVTSVASAIDYLKTRNYSTMITDLKMPINDGMSFSRRVREQFPDLNIVLFVGSSTSQIMNLILDPKVLEISEANCKHCGFGDMLLRFINREYGKTFLLEQSPALKVSNAIN